MRIWGLGDGARSSRSHGLVEAKRAASPGLPSGTGYSARTCGLGQALWLLRLRPRGHLTAELHPASTWPPLLAPGISEAAGKAPWAGFRTKINRAVRQRLAKSVCRTRLRRTSSQPEIWTMAVSLGRGERGRQTGAAGTQRQHPPGPAWSLRAPARGLTGPRSPRCLCFTKSTHTSDSISFLPVCR